MDCWASVSNISTYNIDRYCVHMNTGSSFKNSKIYTLYIRNDSVVNDPLEILMRIGQVWLVVLYRSRESHRETCTYVYIFIKLNITYITEKAY